MTCERAHPMMIRDTETNPRCRHCSRSSIGIGSGRRCVLTILIRVPGKDSGTFQGRCGERRWLWRAEVLVAGKEAAALWGSR